MTTFFVRIIKSLTPYKWCILIPYFIHSFIHHLQSTTSNEEWVPHNLEEHEQWCNYHFQNLIIHWCVTCCKIVHNYLLLNWQCVCIISLSWLLFSSDKANKILRLKKKKTTKVKSNHWFIKLHYFVEWWFNVTNILCHIQSHSSRLALNMIFSWLNNCW